MSKYHIEKLSPCWEKQWDNFVENSNNGTIFHKLKFLEYHGRKFKNNESHIVFLKGESLFGVMPMVIFEKDEKKIAKSPYGASYGGFVFNKILNYCDSKEIIKLFIDYAKKLKINEIMITPPINIYHKKYSDTFILLMLEKGFKLVNSDITSIVYLNSNNLESEEFTSRARNMARMARKARKAGVEIVNKAAIKTFWKIMEKTFTKLGICPTHTLAEFQYLNRIYPDQIYADIAVIDKKPIAGIGYFKINSRVNMSFYLCSDIKYKQTQALSLLIYESLLKSKRQGFKYFDFGTSSANMIGRENIFRFKESFGAVGLFRNTYKWINN